MRRFFITYGDSAFKLSKERISTEAENLRLFDCVIPYSPKNLSRAVRQSPLMKYKRGGGLWLWKVDIVLQTLLHRMEEGDFLVYCDAGCTLQSSKEWDSLFSELNEKDICALRIHQKNIRWIKREAVDFFASNPHGWINNYQYCAGVLILKKSILTVNFVQEWLDTMLCHPDFVLDVLPEDRAKQHECFIESRHDQAIYSALIYKYLHTGKIATRWEHIEGRDYFCKQAIVASRISDADSANITPSTFLCGFLKSILKPIIRIFLKK